MFRMSLISQSVVRSVGARRTSALRAGAVWGGRYQRDQKKSPNVYKNCLRMLGDLGKLIVAKGIKKLPKVQKIARSGHTAPES